MQVSEVVSHLEGTDTVKVISLCNTRLDNNDDVTVMVMDDDDVDDRMRMVLVAGVRGGESPGRDGHGEGDQPVQHGAGQ